MALDETQVFKFLALRAPERPLGGTPPDRFIRDPRSLSREGPAGQRIAVALDTMPRPLAELTDDAEVALRDRLGLTAQASVPEAVLALRRHLSGLDTRAWELRTDSRFTTALAAHDGVDDIRRRLPAAKPDPGTAMDENVIGRIHLTGARQASSQSRRPSCTERRDFRNGLP